MLTVSRCALIPLVAICLGGRALGAEPVPLATVQLPAAPEAAPDYPAAPWRVSVAFGSSSLNGKPFERLLQNGNLGRSAVAGDWQPSAVGLRLGLDQLSSRQSRGAIVSHYDSTELRLAATYLAPLPWHSVQVIGYGGVLAASQAVRLDDGEVRLKSSSTDFGPLVGLDFGTPPVVGLRAFLRFELSEQRVRFSAFAFQRYFVERSALLGGSYAF